MDYGRAFGAYDVRGTYGQEIDETLAYRLAIAYSRFISPQGPGTFVVGMDARASSRPLATAFISGLATEGHAVTFLGVASTPLVTWYGNLTEATGNVAVTASHLPIRFNGFKLAGAQGAPIARNSGLAEIADHVAANQQRYVPAELPAHTTTAVIEYVRFLAGLTASRRPIKIAIDAGNSPAGPQLEHLFSMLKGIELVPLNMTPSISPKRSLNPLDDGALDELVETVLVKRCDLGAAFDGDGDRLVVVDELGKQVSADAISALLAIDLSTQEPGSAVLYDLRMSRSVPEILTRKGLKPQPTRVGHSYIKQSMQDQDACFACELSGHYYFKDCFYTDNAERALIALLSILSRADVPLSSLIADLQIQPSSGELNFEIHDPQTMIAHFSEVFQDGKQDTLDGLSVDFADWWFNARISKTEGVLRLVVGAADVSVLTERTAKLADMVRSYETKKQRPLAHAYETQVARS